MCVCPNVCVHTATNEHAVGRFNGADTGGKKRCNRREMVAYLLQEMAPGNRHWGQTPVVEQHQLSGGNTLFLY